MATVADALDTLLAVRTLCGAGKSHTVRSRLGDAACLLQAGARWALRDYLVNRGITPEAGYSAASLATDGVVKGLGVAWRVYPTGRRMMIDRRVALMSRKSAGR